MFHYSLITVNFGNYDSFKEPEEVDSECEYVYVTDNPNIKSDIFKVILIDNLSSKSNLYKSFYVRYHIEEFVSCKICIWVDASVQIHRSLRPIVNEFIDSKADILCPIFYKSISTFEFMKIWYNATKNSVRKRLPRLSFIKTKRYIERNLNISYKGHAEANFQILNLESTKLIEMRKNIWKELLMLGVNGDPLRVDEVVLSVNLQKKYKSIKVFKVCRHILHSSFMTFYNHNGTKKVYLPRMKKECIYFYNKPQKVHIFE